jgi:methyl-accepting chemotaxis protein
MPTIKLTMSVERSIMQLLNNKTIKFRLMLGFTLMIIITACLGFIGYRSLGVINRGVQDLFSLRMPTMDYIIEADRDLQQLLVAERSMIFAETGSALLKDLVADYEENLGQSATRWNKYKALASSAEEKAIIPQYEEARARWQKLSRQVVDACLGGTPEGKGAAMELSLGKAKEAFEEMRGFLDQLTELNLNMASQAEQAASSTYGSTVFQLLGIVGVSLLLGILLMWGIGSGVTRSLGRVIRGLTEASDLMASGSNHVASSSQGLAEGASEQAASIEETSSSLEEMSSMTSKNAENAGQANQMMQQASEIVDKVDRHMGEMSEAIDEITRTSEETGKIIKTIDEIAFQTNLLALNAAVEAARAGEAGAGFAVVADEVRNLAMRAAEAAKDTARLIEDTIKAVQSGNELTRLTREAFKENVEISGKTGELIDEIAAASSEQARGIDQVNTAVAEMDKVVQRVAASAEESASTSEEMSAQAVQMKGFVSDLSSLVGGNSGNRPARPGSAGATGKEMSLQPVGTTERRLRKNDTLPGATEVNPEQVIPMESSSEFQDF